MFAISVSDISLALGFIMTPAQAAERAGLSRTSIMNAIKSGALRAVRDNRNRWQISDDELTAFCEAIETVSVKVSDTATDTSVSDLQAELRVRDAQIAGQAALIDELRAQIDYLKKPFWKRW